MSKQSSEMPDKEASRSVTTRGRKRKGNYCLWEFWQSVWGNRPPRWRMIRAYHTMDEAVRNKKKAQRDSWWRNCTYKIALAGEKPDDEWDKNWKKDKQQ